jgi:hypothetical protein
MASHPVAFPSFDLTDVDLVPAARQVVRAGNAAGSLARDATYTAVGLGILSFQRLQVRRRELERALAKRTS